MTDLISRLEALTAPSREIDAEIAAHWRIVPDFNPSSYIVPLSYKAGEHHGEWRVKVWTHVPDREPRLAASRKPPRYVESIDAALMLVPEGLYWKFSQMHEGVLGSHAWIFGPSSPVMSDVKIWGECISTPEHRRIATPAIALVIACLRAREESKPMTAARDVIADKIIDQGWCREQDTALEMADDVLAALHSAGYIIIKDRTDPEGGIPGRQT